MSSDTTPASALYIDETRLARLQRWAAIASASAEEDGYLRRELNSQLASMVVKVLDPALDAALAAAAPAMYGVPLAPRCAPLRDDRVESYSDADGLLACAPRVQDRYFVVPASEHETL